MAGEAWEGSAIGRLSGGFGWYERDMGRDWISESAPLAERAAHAVRNDPVVAALKVSVITGTHGSTGLRFRSLVDGGVATDDGTDLRDRIEEVICEASEGVNLDANGLMTRRELDEALDEMAFVRGEGFGIAAWLPNRPAATTGMCWRIIGRERVGNPPGQVDGPTLYQGIKLDSGGSAIGIWVAPSDRAKLGEKKAWTYVPWYDDNGIPKVIHRTGCRPPGTYRGVSEIAPILPIARHAKALVEAYVIGKRSQASLPIFIICEDPVAAAAKDRNGVVWGPNTVIEPGKVYYLGLGSDVKFPTITFQGADFGDFLDILYRNGFAAVGQPIDVVLAQLGKTNMAASRSAWLQYYRQCERRQDAHIQQAAKVIDANIIAEAVYSGRLVLPAGMTIKEACKGRYTRPPRSMPDPLKEAQAVKAWIELGRDKTGLWAESAGVDFRESTIQRAEDDEWSAQYATPAPAPAADATAAPAKPAEPESPAPEDDDNASPNPAAAA